MIAIFVVTYRRPHLLRRALESVRAQTRSDWQVRVVNDDPEDDRVARLIAELNDARIVLFQPVRKRGAAGSFNEAFRAQDCDFATLLEDDNWWEPGFLETMITTLEANPSIDVACMNERIWKEQPDGSWTDTGQVIWSAKEDEPYSTTIAIACGSAKLCNSSLLFRRKGKPAWTTPDDIPVDVTEHFRERVLPQPFLLVAKPLVNYAETLATNRDTSGSRWGQYQCLLIGSCFASLPAKLRPRMAQTLFRDIGKNPSPRATALLIAALACSEARALLGGASFRQLVKLVLTIGRRPVQMLSLLQAKKRLTAHWQFLLDSPWNRRLAEGSEAL